MSEIHYSYCKNCGKRFGQKGSRRIYCSIICYRVVRQKKYIPKTSSKNNKTIVLANGLEVLNNAFGTLMSGGDQPIISIKPIMSPLNYRPAKKYGRQD
jgi:hypothetical protein